MLNASTFAVLLLFLIGCGSTRPHSVAPVPPGESVIHSADQAISVALDYLRRQGLEERYDFNAAEAHEEPASWSVIVPYHVPSRPPGSLIVVSKRDGVARSVPLR